MMISLSKVWQGTASCIAAPVLNMLVRDRLDILEQILEEEGVLSPMDKQEMDELIALDQKVSAFLGIPDFFTQQDIDLKPV